MSDAIVVAVRCRPFNKRELALGTALSCIEMRGGLTVLHDSTKKEEPKKFTFDYSYWSVNSEDAHYATNTTVYDDLGKKVLDNAIGGYNCCLFAYGQTGSGKSYSMVGYGSDKGIVPLVLQELFVRTAQNTDPNVRYLVEASMMEIYNEKVRDLFNPKNNPPAGMKIRDHPKMGPYVEGLSRSVVQNYAQVESLMEQGTAARTVASTQMNATSSRAHTVFQIVFTTTTHDDITKKESSITSKINLVDLAGSERISKTGATGATLKEGININKSLTSLGDCIEKLAARSKQKKGAEEVHVPFRNSVLTWLLKESLGGNSRSIMIAAISPADDNYDETLSTLRYADRAKQIKNKAIVNEDENAKIIRQLREEILALRRQLESGAGGAGLTSVRGSAAINMSDAEREEYVRLKDQMKQNEELIRNMNMTWEDKLRETERIAADRAEALGREMAEELEKKKKQTAHMVNLHKDRLMSECLHYFFPINKTIRVCMKTSSPTADDIIVQGLQIKPEHAKIENKDNLTLTITPATADARIYVNGQLITSKHELHHNDRLILGAHLVFKVILPNHATQETDSEIDWEYAQRELSVAGMQSAMPTVDLKAQEEQQRVAAENERQIKALANKIEIERIKSDKLKQQTDREYAQKLEQLAKQRDIELEQTRKAVAEAQSFAAEKVLKEKLAARERELEAEKQQLAKMHEKQVQEEQQKQQQLRQQLEAQSRETQRLRDKHQFEQKDRNLLEETLLVTIPMINEANAICTELDQHLRFSIKLRQKPSASKMEHTEVRIRVTSIADASIDIEWTLDVFTERLYLMRELYGIYLQTHNTSMLEDIFQNDDSEVNPFVLTSAGDGQQVGTCRLYLQPLYHLLPITEHTPIIDYKGATQGQLHVVIQPIPPAIDEKMQADPSFQPTEDDLLYEEDDMSALADQQLILQFTITKAMGLPLKQCKQPYIKYQFVSDMSTQQTPTVNESTSNPRIEYKRRIVINNVTDDFMQSIKTEVLELHVFAQINALDEDTLMSVRKRGQRSRLNTTASERAENNDSRSSTRSDHQLAFETPARGKVVSPLSSPMSPNSRTAYTELETKYQNVVKTIAKLVDCESGINYIDEPELLVPRVNNVMTEVGQLNTSNANLSQALQAEKQRELSLEKENNKLKLELDDLQARSPRPYMKDNIALRRELTQLQMPSFKTDSDDDDDAHTSKVAELQQQNQQLLQEVQNLKRMTADEILLDNEKLRQQLEAAKQQQRAPASRPTTAATQQVTTLKQQLTALKTQKEKDDAELKTLRTMVQQLNSPKQTPGSHVDTQRVSVIDSTLSVHAKPSQVSSVRDENHNPNTLSQNGTSSEVEHLRVALKQREQEIQKLQKQQVVARDQNNSKTCTIQ